MGQLKIYFTGKYATQTNSIFTLSPSVRTTTAPQADHVTLCVNGNQATDESCAPLWCD